MQLFLVFRRKLNQSLEKKFDVLEAKLADIQNDVEDLKTIITEQRQTQIQTSSKNLSKPKLVPPPASLKRNFEDEKIVTLNKLKELYGFSFPLKTRKDFEEFDAKIVDGFYDDLVCICVIATFTNRKNGTLNIFPVYFFYLLGHSSLSGGITNKQYFYKIFDHQHST